MANAFHSAGTSVGSTSIGAIVGSIETPFAAVQLGFSGSDLLTTGDLQFSEAGEMGGLNQFAVELWFQTASVLATTQVFLHGPLSVTGNYQWQLNLLGDSTISADVSTGSGVLTAHSPSTITAGTGPKEWNHIVFSADAGSLNLYLNGALVAANPSWGGNLVSDLGTTVGALDMRITGPNSPVTQAFDELAVYRTALTAARVLAHYRAGTQMGFPFQKPGERLTAIINAAGSHIPCNFQAGIRTVTERYMSGQSPLEEMRVALEAEDVDAALFAAADGTLTFLADGHRSSAPYNSSQVALGNAGGTEIPYEDISFDYSPSFLVNEWNVTRTTRASLTPVTQTRSDAASISRSFKRSQSLSDVPVQTDADAAAIATGLLAKHKDAMFRISSVTLNLLDPAVAAAVFRRELMDRISIRYTPPGGGARILQDVYIQKIDITGDNNGTPIRATWGVSPL